MARNRTGRGSAAKAGGERDKRALFLKRLGAIFNISPSEAEALASTPLTQSVRINPLAARPVDAIGADLEALGAELEPVAWCENSFHLHSSKRVVAESGLFADGEVYIQNASSFAPSLALDAQPDQDILDLCAAPGGKSIHIAALIGGRARLWLNDALPARIRKLEAVLAQFHVTPDRVTSHPAQYADKFIDREFDRILIDAQCTGEGMIDLSAPNPMRFWSPERITKYSRLQQRMLMSAWKRLKPGGVLVYSTCTYAPEENEAPLDHLLRHREDAAMEPVELNLPGRTSGLARWEGRRFDPQLVHAVRIRAQRFMEGFFLARVRKRA
ncbi:MAG: RsmB/NOP family class I SAM-dependent RNA methyltransferase [Pseudomonadota bacterium]